MRPSDAVVRWGVAAAALWLLPAAAPAAPPDETGDLAAMRQKSIAAAATIQRDEGRIRALQHQIDLLGQDVAGRRRGLDESRPVQERLLGILELLSRNLPEPSATVAAAPLDRIRGKLLIDALVPGLRLEAQALSRELAKIAALRAEIAKHRATVTEVRGTLAKEHKDLAKLTAQRLQRVVTMLPEDAAGQARRARLGQDATDLGDLIRLADAAADRRDKASRARDKRQDGTRARGADPTRPASLRAFDPPQSALLIPVSGIISERFGASETAGKTGQGLSFSALPGAEVVAPFDGRVVYAGPFGNFGLVLIIRHGLEYHSVLAGLGRVDTLVDEWVRTGEPVGSLPDASPSRLSPRSEEAGDGGSDSPLYFELRRDGRPVDPQPWLETRADERDGPNGDQRVRQ